jgi:hypothetical protein
MPEPLDIRRHGGDRSNYRLRGEPVQLVARTIVLDKDGNERGAIEVVGTEKYRPTQKVRVSRKQKAAREAVPRATITIVKELIPAPPEVAIARFEGKSEHEIEVAFLEARIKKLLGIVEAQKHLQELHEQSLRRLERAFKLRHSR